MTKLVMYSMYVCVCEGVQICMMIHVCLLKLSQAEQAHIHTHTHVPYRYSEQLQEAFYKQGRKTISIKL